MTPDDACRIINEDLIAPHGYRLSAHPCPGRFDDAIVLETTYRPRLSQFPPDYDVIAPNDVLCRDYVRVGALADENELVCAVIDVLVGIEAHEIREYVRLRPDMRAPAHPHQGEGIDRWARFAGTRPEADYQFGLATG